MAKTRFFKTIIQIEVLSEDEPVSDFCSLENLCFEITQGAWSGQKDIISFEELTSAQMAKALIAQGSDPEFFNILTNI